MPVERPAGTVTVALDADGIPHYTIHEGVAWDVIPWTAGLRDLAARRRRLLRFAGPAVAGEPGHDRRLPGCDPAGLSACPRPQI
jgi:hypothetical protein